MTDRVTLDQPLPAELMRRSVVGFAGYQSYPVFSAPWLRKRTMLFALAISAIGAILAIAEVARSHDVVDGLSLALHFIIGGLALSSSGPALATLVRHRRWPLQRERWAVVAALGAGVLISLAVDLLISNAMESTLANGPAPLPAPPVPATAAGIVLNLVVILVIYVLVGGGLAVRQFWAEPARWAEVVRSQEVAVLRSRNQALDTHLSMLQAQIEPHFLFNTLASVRSLVACDPQQATEAIDALVDYLRATIPRLRDTKLDSTLGQQIELCESYLRLMSIRMGRLQWHVACDQALHALPFPPLLLLTLVENSIKHGLEPNPGPGSIQLTVQRTGQSLKVQIKDDGLGLREPIGVGVGLQNVREQLRARYRDNANFSLVSQAPHGTTATITLLIPTP